MDDETGAFRAISLIEKKMSCVYYGDIIYALLAKKKIDKLCAR